MYLLLFSLWLVFNGRITPEILLFGLWLTVILGWIAYRLMGYSPRTELAFCRRLPLFLLYLLVLFWKILLANRSMIAAVLRPKRRLKPTLVRIRVPLRSGFARFVLANSITLTPGTLTVESEGEYLTVHCLHPDLLEDTENGQMIRLLQRMEAPDGKPL